MREGQLYAPGKLEHAWSWAEDNTWWYPRGRSTDDGTGRNTREQALAKAWAEYDEECRSCCDCHTDSMAFPNIRALMERAVDDAAAARADTVTLHEAALRVIRAAWQSGYMACLVDAAEGTADGGRSDGCDDPEDYLNEALSAGVAS